MADHVSREKRSAIMRSVTNKNTTPEILARRAAHKLGLRFRIHSAELPGRPDMVLPRWKTVVFVNGCFWHRHPGCRRTTIPKSNVEFWTEKFRANVERDKRNYAMLVEMGWRVVILWQCEVKTIDAATEILRRHFSIKAPNVPGIS